MNDEHITFADIASGIAVIFWSMIWTTIITIVGFALWLAPILIIAFAILLVVAMAVPTIQ